MPHNTPHHKQQFSHIANFKLAVTADGGVLLDIKNDLIHKLSSVGVDLLRALAKGMDENEIVSELAIRYNMHPDHLRDDLSTLHTRIHELGLHVPTDLPLEVAPLATPLSDSLPSFPWYGKKNSGQGLKPSLPTRFLAFLGLVWFDVALSLLSMKTVCRIVHTWRTRQCNTTDESAIRERICSAVERACVWYSKETLCLQRSAVTTCLLRSAGLPAEMVIATQIMPLEPHAWVEIRGSVVNDHKRVATVFEVIERY